MFMIFSAFQLTSHIQRPIQSARMTIIGNFGTDTIKYPKSSTATCSYATSQLLNRDTL